MNQARGKQVLLVGATGLVGQGVLEVCLRAPDVSRVTVLVRRPFDARQHKLRVLQVPAFTQAALATLDLRGLAVALFDLGDGVGVDAGREQHRRQHVHQLQRVPQALRDGGRLGDAPVRRR